MQNRWLALLHGQLPRSKRLAKLRRAWGAPGDNDAWRASAYFDLTCGAATPQLVDDKTWLDLEFPKIFSAIDTTITAIGRQYLFKQLRTFEYDTETLSRRQEAYDVLRTNSALRERLQLSLQRLHADSATYIVELLYGPPPAKPRRHALVVPWVLLTVLVTVGAIVHWVPLWLCGSILAVNAIGALIFSPKLDLNAEALTSCGRLLEVAERIASLQRKKSDLSYAAQLVAETAKRRRLKSQLQSLKVLDRLRSVDILGGIIILVNGCFLLKLALYTRSIDQFIRHRAEWESTFELVGAIDASIAIANFHHRFPDRCRPRICSDQVIDIQNGYHPLLAAPVKNSIALGKESALVTGSNMAGKTTFIKMVAINIILGHTIGTCLADSATIPRSRVMALIRGDQSVASGKSRYFAEAEGIRDFVAESARGECGVFVIDEPFSGTNTVERVAAAAAVLAAISLHAQALVTTHDVELQHLLNDRFRLFHFQEDPAVEGFFDYHLRAGAGTQRNAIRVLERLGFPSDIIARALALVAATGG
ncbi:MAG TPA: hypothetical protein VGG49_06470 [Steroidobacteraceae bacterium]|jgi:hypothetical protein